MTDTAPTDPETAESGESHQGSARKNRGVRFADFEWDEVKIAAQALGVTPAEFVRDTILALVRSPGSAANAADRVDLVPLIERTFRYTYMLATKMRDDMIESGHREKLDELINEARELQVTLQIRGSE